MRKTPISFTGEISLLELPRQIGEELFFLHAKSIPSVACPRQFFDRRTPRGSLTVESVSASALGEIEATSPPEVNGLSPVVIADGFLVYGLESIYKARQQGIPTVEVLDLSGLIDPKVAESAVPLDRLFPKMSTRGKGLNPHESPAFKRWFANSYVTKDGEPLMVFHGTTGDFTCFSNRRLNIESNLGAGYYFTNSPVDASTNYAGIGPDLQNRIERLADHLVNAIEDNPQSYGFPDSIVDDREALEKAAEELAMIRLTDHGGMVIPVYLSMQNPVQIGGPNPTLFDIELADDDYGYLEGSGSLFDFFNALRNICADERFVDVNAQSVITDILDELDACEQISAERLIELASKSDGLCYAFDAESELADNATYEILRRAFEAMGFDGFIDFTVNKKFGSERLLGRPMQGMDSETVHYVVFKPTQIKSAIGNSGIFDPESPSLTDHPDEHELDMALGIAS